MNKPGKKIKPCGGLWGIALFLCGESVVAVSEARGSWPWSKEGSQFPGSAEASPASPDWCLSGQTGLWVPYQGDGHTDFYTCGLSNPSYLFCEPINYCAILLRCAHSAVPRKLISRKGCHEVSLFDSGRRGSDRSDGPSSQWAWKLSISPSTRSVSFGKWEMWCQYSALHMAPSLREQSTG